LIILIRSHDNMWYLNIANIKASPKVTLIYQGTDVLGNYVILKKVIPLNNGMLIRLVYLR
jgi:hypothetical protein